MCSKQHLQTSNSRWQRGARCHNGFHVYASWSFLELSTHWSQYWTRCTQLIFIERSGNLWKAISGELNKNLWWPPITNSSGVLIMRAEHIKHRRYSTADEQCTINWPGKSQCHITNSKAVWHAGKHNSLTTQPMLHKTFFNEWNRPKRVFFNRLDMSHKVLGRERWRQAYVMCPHL